MGRRRKKKELYHKVGSALRIKVLSLCGERKREVERKMFLYVKFMSRLVIVISSTQNRVCIEREEEKKTSTQF